MSYLGQATRPLCVTKHAAPFSLSIVDPDHTGHACSFGCGQAPLVVLLNGAHATIPMKFSISEPDWLRDCGGLYLVQRVALFIHTHQDFLFKPLQETDSSCGRVYLALAEYITRRAQQRLLWKRSPSWLRVFSRTISRKSAL